MLFPYFRWITPIFANTKNIVSSEERPISAVDWGRINFQSTFYFAKVPYLSGLFLSNGLFFAVVLTQFKEVRIPERLKPDESPIWSALTDSLSVSLGSVFQNQSPFTLTGVFLLNQIAHKAYGNRQRASRRIAEIWIKIRFILDLIKIASSGLIAMMVN